MQSTLMDDCFILIHVVRLSRQQKTGTQVTHGANRNASLYFKQWSTPTKKGTRALIGFRSTAGLMAGIVYGGDIQSIRTDH